MNQPLTNTQSLSQKIESRIDPATVSDLTLTNAAGGINLENMAQVMDLAKMMAISDVAVRKHLRNNPGACLAVAVQAFEWKMSPFAVANKSYVVNDQLAYEAQLIQAVITMRAPIVGRVKTEYSGEGNKRKIRVWATTTDLEEVDYESPEIGNINPKNSPLWKNDPDQQLHYFAVRSWCRRHFPDVILGVYASDELEDSAPMKDVNARPSGLAARLGAAKAENGFNADAVGSALGGEKAEVTVEAEPAQEQQTSNPKPAEVVPDIDEARHQGSRAALAGDDREAPADAHPDEQVAWLEAYDKTAEEANAS